MKLKININKGHQQVWFSSDFHFGHTNIVRGTSKWTGQTRDFDTVEEHDKFIIDKLNEKVSVNDFLFFLGDFTFRGFDNDKDIIKNLRNSINCKNIYFVYGNHDEIIETNDDLKDLFTAADHYIDLTVKVLEHNTPTIKTKLDLSHYSKRTWSGMYAGNIMLYGHSHNMLEDFLDKDTQEPYKTMDVGVDTREDFSPYSLTEIIEIMDKRFTPELHERMNKK